MAWIHSSVPVLSLAASTQLRISQSFSKKKGRAKLPQGDAGRRADGPLRFPRGDRPSAPTLARVWGAGRSLGGLGVVWGQTPNLGSFI